MAIALKYTAGLILCAIALIPFEVQRFDLVSGAGLLVVGPVLAALSGWTMMRCRERSMSYLSAAGRAYLKLFIAASGTLFLAVLMIAAGIAAVTAGPLR